MRPVLLLALSILLSISVYSQQINGSYYNVSRPSGGPVNVGDVLEIRAVIGVPSGTSITNVWYTDVVPTGTSFVNGSLSVRTNEDVVVPAIANTGTYTNAADGDRGQVVGSNITVYIGDGATSTTGGNITGGTTKPQFYTSASILMVAYQVTVTGALGSSIVTAGTFHYTSGTTAKTTNLTANQMTISKPYDCISTSSTNLITDETNGTFGSGSGSGTTPNRSTSSSNVTGFTKVNLTTGAPADGAYSIVNNTSPTSYTGSTPASSDKVFSVWDVLGDHTGASSSAGNAPTASGATGGYLLAVNASYAPSVVFHSVVNGLTPHNTFTVSMWIRNLCPSCGSDPNANASSGTPGIQPNLGVSFAGANYYSTGNIAYTGGWIQKTFTFQNGGGTSATLDIKNNAPGGGGNDWAIDDISLTQCLVILPVGLQSFTGKAGPDGNLLQWTTSFSADIQHFDVERSTDGSHFAAIGQVLATPDTSSYSFIDGMLPPNGGNFIYRLHILDLDGVPSYSNVVRIGTGNATGSLTTRLTPNPTHNSSTLSIQSIEGGKGQASLWSSSGALIWSQPLTLPGGGYTTDLRLPDLPRGIYIVKTTISTSSTVIRLVVE
jgi:hypothetical protein